MPRDFDLVRLGWRRLDEKETDRFGPDPADSKLKVGRKLSPLASDDSLACMHCMSGPLEC